MHRVSHITLHGWQHRNHPCHSITSEGDQRWHHPPFESSQYEDTPAAALKATTANLSNHTNSASTPSGHIKHGAPLTSNPPSMNTHQAVDPKATTTNLFNHTNATTTPIGPSKHGTPLTSNHLNMKIHPATVPGATTNNPFKPTNDLENLISYHKLTDRNGPPISSFIGT